MRRSARQVLATLSAAALLVLAGAAPATVRANGFAPQANTWVATTGTPTGTNAGTSCSAPGFVVDGTNDEVEIGYAILDVLPGGTVHLCPGSYRVAAGQGYDKSFTLAGAGRNATFVLGTAEFLESGAYDSGGTEFLYSVIDSTTLSVRDLTIRGFYGDSDGGYGALYGADFVLDRVRMDHNGSQDGDGGAIWANSVIARDSIFEDNFASEDGGAIDATDLTLERTNFSRNKAGINGGAFTATGDVVIRKSDFIDNEAGNQAGAGFTYSTSTVLIDHARFRGNQATASHGGALRLYQSDSVIRYSSFTGNRAGEAGGAFDAFGGTLTVISSRFYSNRAETNGGAFVSWEQNALKVLRSRFLDNQTQGNDGGAIFEHGSVAAPTIRYNVFDRNRSVYGSGGGLALDAGDIAGGSGPNLLGVTNNTFRYNRAPVGNAIQVYQCEAASAASVRAITWKNRILRRGVDASSPRVNATTVSCTPPG
jgi:predicted outer membrane repeat protein